MKRLILFTNKNQKRLAFDGIISRQNKLIHTEYCLIDSYKETVESILDKTFYVEYPDYTFKVDDIDNCFDRFEKVATETNLITCKLNTVDANYILNIVYGDDIETPVSMKKIANFFDIEVTENNKLNYDGIAVANNGDYKIEYKKGDYGNVKDRFTVGHELGHIFLHFPSSNSSFIDNINEDYAIEKSTQMAARGAASSSFENLQQEQEADAFASALLMPENLIIKIIKESGDTKPYMSSLKRKFNVSNGAIFRALKKYGLLDKVIDDCRWW
jgi:Zn-dependent peptidase ImmA (M78 family)